MSKFVKNLQKTLKSRVVEADFTWTGTRFEPGVLLEISSDGKISALHRRSSGGPLPEVDLRFKGEAIMPGFVNCHSHAFQRGLRGLAENYSGDAPDGFWSWRNEMYALVGKMDEKMFYEHTLKCFQVLQTVQG